PSALAIGIPLVPVTLLFGPVASLNVALTIGPALSGLSLFWLLRRFGCSAPAAFVGGAIFGFSPFVFVNLAVAHLNLGYLMVVPLVVACLDELLLRQERSPGAVGLVLGLLVAVQFFLSSEILTTLAIVTAMGAVMVIGYGAFFHRRALVARAPHAFAGFAVALGVSVLLLAYPAWFALGGPAHLSGLIWPSLHGPSRDVVPSGLWNLRFSSPSAARFFAGYEGGGALPAEEYLGTGALVVVGSGLLLWRRDRRLWLFGALGLGALALSLGVNRQYWTPWRLFARVPLVDNALADRIVLYTTMCVALMVAIILDHAYKVVRDRIIGVRQRRHSTDSAWLGPLSRVAGAGLAIAVAAVATVPMATAMAGDVPLTTESVAVPRWFTAAAPHLGSGQVVLTFPPPASGGSAMTWQAVDSMNFAMATGGGPESIPRRAGKERAGYDLILNASAVFSVLAPATRRNLVALRSALAGWGVTMVVMPDPRSLVPRYDRSAATAWALAMFTLVIGRQPRLEDDAWVWSSVTKPSRLRGIGQGDFARCTARAVLDEDSPDWVPRCVQASARA
ncbi:MAG: hypothetical protein ACRDZP_03525, partial [Acidimicrobiales bacterium]